MLFNSYIFLLIFLPAVFAGWHFFIKYTNFSAAKIFLVLASLWFYGYFKPGYLIILVISILLNYLMCTKIWNSGAGAVRSLMLTAGCMMNVGILVYFKYTGFLLENINLFFGTAIAPFKVLMPLGISFYTFQQLSFLIDAFRGQNSKVSIVDYALFVTFFPQLIAGPIVLPGEMLPQFNDLSKRSISWQNMNTGLFIFACGLMKKCFLADTLAIVANTGFDSGTPLNFCEAWIVSLAFSFQLYFDFSGYCDMAMGIGKFFNIELPLNFNSPYKSTDFQSFWRRWHMTLGRFMMNYLYIPLGGNKNGIIRTCINLLIVFIVSGIWHGAGWLFLLWGGLHGMGILINRVWVKCVLKKHPGWAIPDVPATIMTFFFVNIFWVFFRATTLGRAGDIIYGMFDFTRLEWLSKPFRKAIDDYGFEKDTVLIICAVAAVIAFFLPNVQEISKKLENRPVLRMVMSVVFMVIGFWCVGRLSPFLYFNF